MKYLLVLFFVVSILSAQGQSTRKLYTADKKVFTIVEEMPSFPDGEQAMQNFIKQNLKPVCATGRVYVTFTVDTSGLVIETEILKGLSAACDSEAVRVVNLMPAWNPGKQNGRNVQVQYNLPVNFGDKK